MNDNLNTNTHLNHILNNILIKNLRQHIGRIQQVVFRKSDTGMPQPQQLQLGDALREESELIPPSSAGGRSSVQQADGTSTCGGSVKGDPAPPTPPRKALGARKGVACSVTLPADMKPNAEGQWTQPIKWTSSMQASPVGSEQSRRGLSPTGTP